MSARTVPYPPPGYRLRVPEPLWEDALATMRSYAVLGSAELGARGAEALVYLGGVVVDAEIIVTGLYRLNHEAQGDRVVVAPAEARWLLRTLRARDEKLVGQMHSHRGLAGHSPGDDAWAASFHEGFLSIVVPRFGAAVMALADCAVLEYCGGRFMPLAKDEVERRVRVYSPIAEHASRAALIETSPSKEEGWPGFVARLKSIARRPR